MVDSIWEYQTIRTYFENDYDLTHKYYVNDSSHLTDYVFVENGLTKFKAKDLHQEKGSLIGNNVYVLKHDSIDDAAILELLVARPGSLHNCTSVDIVLKDHEGKLDTIGYGYNPESDILFLEIDNINYKEVFVTAYICGKRSGNKRIPI